MFKRFKLCFNISVVCFIASFAALLSIMFLDMCSDEYVKKSISYIIASVFWVGIIGEQIFFWICNHLRKRIEIKRSEISYSNGIGIISFFKNPNAVVADIVMFASVLVFALMLIFKVVEQWAVVLCLSIIFLSFNLHSFLNGKNYIYKQSYQKYLNNGEKLK